MPARRSNQQPKEQVEATETLAEKTKDELAEQFDVSPHQRKDEMLEEIAELGVDIESGQVLNDPADPAYQRAVELRDNPA